MAKLIFFKDERGGNIAIQKFKKPLIAVILNKKTLSFLFTDGSKKSLKLNLKQVKLLSKSGKIYQYTENPTKVVGVNQVKIIN